MSRFWFVVFVIVSFVIFAKGLTPNKCQMFPKEKHCLIEYRVRDIWPHTVRYVYNWYTKSCFEVRWSDNCPPVVKPPISNNFPTAGQCMDECGGWA